MTEKDLSSIKLSVEIANIFLNTAHNHIDSTVKVFVKTKKHKDMAMRVGLNLAKTNITSVIGMLDHMVRDYQAQRKGVIECPSCGKANEIYDRIVGYLRPVKNWNAGKQEEFKDRKRFEI